MVVEKYVDRVHSEHAVLDIGQEIGALVIYTSEDLRGRQIDVSPKGNDAQKTHTDVLERRVDGRPVFAALFLALPEGDYTLWWRGMHPVGSVTIHGGSIVEVDWRNTKFIEVGSSQPFLDMLPPRYRNGQAVCTTPMGSAPMRYTREGKVAWDEMWTDFCDLALAGGPPHRGTLLEPVSPEDARANMDDYERVVAEIERGLRLVTGLPTVRSKSLGWVGLDCRDEEAALWLLRAIVVENVCVRREGTVLFLPAGPAFMIEKEIKNVVTVVAKTYHYWNEHIR